MLSVAEQVTDLARQIRLDVPGATTNVQVFGSGAVSLEVRIRDRLFVMDFSPSQGFGVDEVGGTAEEGFNSGYRHGTKKFDEAVEMLRSLLIAT
jgi:hypothetical protein